MRIGVTIDSTCDLPAAFIEKNGIQILPSTIHLNGSDFVDTHDQAETQAFYRKHLASAADAGTSAFTIGQIKDVFLSKLVLDYDFVFCMTVASSRSPIFENATKASFAILSEYKAVRAAAEITGPFGLRVIDTQNLFAGQVITAVEAVRMIKQGIIPGKIREQLEYLVQHTYGFMVPRDLRFIYARARKKGDRSVGRFGVMMASALDIKPVLHAHCNETKPVAMMRHFDDAAKRCFAYIESMIMDGKLLTPTLSLSYGGELAEMKQLPGYTDLMSTCRNHKIEVFQSTMSITSVVNVGEGALTFAFAAKAHRPKI